MLNREDFRKKIEKELKNLDRKKIVHFAWLCAVRALPFLGANGNFNFWEKEKRRKRLYSIFYALDISAAAFAAADDTSTYANAYGAANAAADANATYDARTVATTAARTAAVYAVVYAVVYAARSAADNTSSYAAANAATNAAVARTAAVAARTVAQRRGIDLQEIIMTDLNNIKSGVGIFNKDYNKIYGEDWNNFQKALAVEGCAYWGKLYKEIFDNGFILDKNVLERRLSVPPEKREEGAAAVAAYLIELGKGAARLNEARIIVLGEKGAGKTCLARRLVNPNAPMTTENESTAGVDTTLWKLKNENINVRIWDFAGHTVTHAVHQFFLSERCLYVILYDGRTEERNRLEYWLNHVKNFGGDSKVIILVNKRDQHSIVIPINSLKDQYSIEGLYTFSIQDDKKELEEFRVKAADYIKNNPSWNKLEIPEYYYKVKEDLENLFVRGEQNHSTEIIKKEVFDEIAKKYEVRDTDKLLKDLHALGISLWYKEIKGIDTLVLNPEWISHGVYKIVNWVNEQKKYSVMQSEFSSVFSSKEDSKRYPEEKHEFIFELMKHYELAYETDKEKCLIIPHLLKEDRPQQLPEFPIGESLMARYKADQPLPPNTISRFIVRHNQEIKKEGNEYLVWRYGVVLEDGKGNSALVREEDRVISVSVKGENKTEYMSYLRETLTAIFNSYKSKKPELQYRIEPPDKLPEEVLTENALKENALWLPDKKILAHAVNNIPYFDDNTSRQINLNLTVINYNITAQTLINQQGDKSIGMLSQTFNYSTCNMGLQGSLNDLAQLLKEKGNEEDAQELENTAKALEKVESSDKVEVKKSGIMNRLARIVTELKDEDSTLNKTVKGIKNGISIAKDIYDAYGKISGWMG